MFKKVANNGRILLAVYLCTFAAGVIGFMTFEGYGFIDALYGTSTTITTAGFGDIIPKTDAGKLFLVVFEQWGIVIVLALTIAWVLGKVNPDLYTNEEQIDDDMDREAIKAKLDRLERLLNEQRSS